MRRARWALVLWLGLLAGCGESRLFVGEYAVSPKGEVAFRISQNGDLYVLEKRHGDSWGDRRELDSQPCPKALADLQQELDEQQPTLVCLGQQGSLLAALLHLDKPSGNWKLASYYLIIGLPLPLYKLTP